MTNRERAYAILHYEDYDRLPVVHFGYWRETLAKWADEGHITKEQAENWGDGNAIDAEIAEKLGFDFNWYTCFSPNSGLVPPFETKVVEEFPDGTQYVQNANGVIIVQKPGAGSIPSEIDHILKDRASWEKQFKHRLEFTIDRVNKSMVNVGGGKFAAFDEGGREFLQKGERDFNYGLFCGSMFGRVRDWLGLENSCYLYADGPDLFKEIIDTNADLCYQCVKAVLETGAKFDFAHFWEDICFKNGPLISPAVFEEYVASHYKRITDLVGQYGIDIVSLDCDGCIDALVPIWLKNGVNTMFPIEVGTWNASIEPWRKQFGRELRGVGGVRKHIFAEDDKSAVDAEVERLKPLVELGGYIPCIDHRIAPDGKWELVQYYCDKMRKTFS